MGFKAPRGAGFLTNPKKALYNRVYNRTTVSADDLLRAKRSRSSVDQEPDRVSELPETIVAYCFAAFILVGILMWIGLSFKWSMLLLVGAGIVGVFGEQGGAVVIIGLVLFVGWLFG